MPTWIESHTVLSRHRKTQDCARSLRIRPVYLVGHLHVLWHTAIEQQEDGILSKWSDDAIASAAQYPGDASKFVSLLHDHAWFDKVKIIHDWLDYAGLFLRRKYGTSESGRQKLVDIWRRHGREYGSAHATKKEPEATSKNTNTIHLLDSTLPNLNLPSPLKFNSLGALETEEELITELQRRLGTKAMGTWGGRWRNRIRENKAKVKRVLLTLAEDSKEKKIRNPGGFMNDLWKRWPE